MDFETARDKLLPVLKQYWLPLALGLFGLMLFAYGLISLLSSSSNKDSIVFQSDNSLTSQSADLGNGKIKVDVEGAVVKPGV